MENKHIIYHFKACDLEIMNIYNLFILFYFIILYKIYVIFKFCDFKKAFMHLARSIIAHIFAIFEYFAKQTVYSDSPDHVL